jgi:hypothetical protein
MQLFLGLLLVGFTSNAHAWSSLSSLGIKDPATHLRADSRARCPTSQFFTTAMVSDQYARTSSIDRKTFLAALIGTAFPALTLADSTGKFSSKVIQFSAAYQFNNNALAPVSCPVVSKRCNCTFLFEPLHNLSHNLDFFVCYSSSALPRIVMCPGFKRCAVALPNQRLLLLWCQSLWAEPSGRSRHRGRIAGTYTHTGAHSDLPCRASRR